MNKRVTKCRACGYDLAAEDKIVDLGSQYLVDFVSYDELELAKQREKYPLELYYCKFCELVQLGVSLDPDSMYRQFWYLSGTNPMMVKALEDVVTYAYSFKRLGQDDAVLDIGTNDGTLLKNYGNLSRKCGLDPARNLLGLSRQVSEYTEAEYFSAREAKKLLDRCGASGFKHIFAIAMFYDLEDPTGFLKEVAEVLDKDGVLVVQMNYLKSMLMNMTFDNISHEHLTYYTLSSLNRCVMRAGLSIADASVNAVNGGSLRVAIRHPEASGRMSGYYDVMQREEDYFSTHGVKNRCVAFNNSIDMVCNALRGMLGTAHAAGDTIFAYGASTRGTTLMQTIQPEPDWISGAAERNPGKYGKFMMGTWTPIFSEDYSRSVAQWFLVLPWHFWPAIREREQKWMELGGKFILPLPEPRVERIDR